MSQNLIKELCRKGIIKTIPSFLPESVQYLTIMGSQAYGVSSESSDWDVYGWCIPDKKVIFPHLQGVIKGFGDQGQGFDQWQQHHLVDPSAAGGKGIDYDFSVYGIVKFFQLAMEATPNIIDSLHTPNRCVIWSTPVGRHVRDNRHVFLSRRLYHTLKGYGFSQLDKAKIKDRGEHDQREFEDLWRIPHSLTLAEAEALLEKAEKDPSCLSAFYTTDRQLIDQSIKSLPLFSFREYVKSYREGVKKSKRYEDVKIKGHDSKFLYHVVRLVNQAEQVLTEGEMDLEKTREQLKAVRRGDMSLEEVCRYFDEKERLLGELYQSDRCPLPHKPDEEKIKNLLLECLEQHFGTISEAVARTGLAERYLDDINGLLRKYETERLAEEGK